MVRVETLTTESPEHPNPLIFHFYEYLFIVLVLPSVLWRCWLGGRKGIRPVKNEWWGAGMVVCLEHGADLHMAQLMPLPLTVSCFSLIQIGFTFLVPAHPGSPGQRAIKLRARACVRACVVSFFHLFRKKQAGWMVQSFFGRTPFSHLTSVNWLLLLLVLF